MAGYKNRALTLEFPELSEDGDRVYVMIRNPKLVPIEQLLTGVPVGADGQPLDRELARRKGYEKIANLVIDWHVYDATAVGEEQPLLGLPATADLVAKLPFEISERIAEEVNRVGEDPTVTPDTPAS